MGSVGVFQNTAPLPQPSPCAIFHTNMFVVGRGWPFDGCRSYSKTHNSAETGCRLTGPMHGNYLSIVTVSSLTWGCSGAARPRYRGPGNYPRQPSRLLSIYLVIHTEPQQFVYGPWPYGCHNKVTQVVYQPGILPRVGLSTYIYVRYVQDSSCVAHQSWCCLFGPCGVNHFMPTDPSHMHVRPTTLTRLSLLW